MDEGAALRSWIWSAFGGVFLLALLWSAFFLSKPETLSLLHPSANPAYPGSSTSSIERVPGPTADKPGEEYARAESLSSAAAVPSSQPSPTVPEDRLNAPAQSPAPASSEALLSGTPSVSAPAAAGTGLSVRYGRASRGRLMGRALDPVRN
jgi:hypothetical protein